MEKAGEGAVRMADTLIRVFVRPAQGELTKYEYDKKTTEIANGIIKLIERHGFKLADFIHFDPVDYARPEKRGEVIN